EQDRVSTVFHVECPSSLAKMSPATTAVNSGNPTIPPNTRTTNGMARPEEWTHLPKSASAGTLVCVLMKIVKANGPTRAIAAVIRGSSCEAIFATSTRYTVRTPVRWVCDAGTGALGAVATLTWLPRAGDGRCSQVAQPS